MPNPTAWRCSAGGTLRATPAPAAEALLLPRVFDTFIFSEGQKLEVTNLPLISRGDWEANVLTQAIANTRTGFSSLAETLKS